MAFLLIPRVPGAKEVKKDEHAVDEDEKEKQREEEE